MKTKDYLLQLVITILACFAAYSALAWMLPEMDYAKINAIAILVFSLISLVIFTMAKKASTSPDRNYFLYVVVMNVFLKLIISFVVIVIFVKIQAPADKLYLLPFTTVYLIFTIFETYFLTKAAKVK